MGEYNPDKPSSYFAMMIAYIVMGGIAVILIAGLACFIAWLIGKF